MKCVIQGCENESPAPICPVRGEPDLPIMEVNGPANVLTYMHLAEIKRTGVPSAEAAMRRVEETGMLPRQAEVEKLLWQTCIQMMLWCQRPGIRWHHVVELTRGLSNGDLARLYRWPMDQRWPNVKNTEW